MAHTDPERLALMALGEPGADDSHAGDCAQCQAELRQLMAVVEVARSTPEAERLESPPADLWSRIAAETGVADEADGAGGDDRAGVARDSNGAGVARGGEARVARGGEARVARGGEAGIARDGEARIARGGEARIARGGKAGVARGGGRRRPVLVAAALVLAAAIGAGIWGGVQALTSPQTTVVGQVALRPLPEFPQWRGANGTAVMATGPHGRQVTVTLDAPDRAGFYEVWLLARDGHSMISLGDLGTGHTGTFDMPPGVNLSNYSRLDVSLQAYDGSTVHAKASVVRGALPVAG